MSDYIVALTAIVIRPVLEVARYATFSCFRKGFRIFTPDLSDSQKWVVVSERMFGGLRFATAGKARKKLVRLDSEFSLAIENTHAIIADSPICG